MYTLENSTLFVNSFFASPHPLSNNEVSMINLWKCNLEMKISDYTSQANKTKNHRLFKFYQAGIEKFKFALDNLNEILESNKLYLVYKTPYSNQEIEQIIYDNTVRVVAFGEV